MTFQLIAFFMVLISFSKAEQNQSIQLPTSQVVEESNEKIDHMLTLQVLKDGKVILHGRIYPMDQMGPLLSNEARLFEEKAVALHKVPVIIRADGRVRTEKVQELMELCMDARLTNFKFKARVAK